MQHPFGEGPCQENLTGSHVPLTAPRDCQGGGRCRPRPEPGQCSALVGECSQTDPEGPACEHTLLLIDFWIELLCGDRCGQHDQRC